MLLPFHKKLKVTEFIEALLLIILIKNINMVKKILTVLLLLFLIDSLDAKERDLVKYVNTLQGSYNTSDFSHGRCTPLVGYPQGVNFWSPAVFSYVKKKVKGVGGNGIFMCPLTDRQHLLEQKLCSFDSTSIIGQPHYFMIKTDDGIVSEISPTERCAIFQFSYPHSKEAILMLDRRGGMSDFTVEPNNQRIIGTFSLEDSHYQIEEKRYYILQFNQPFVSYGIVRDSLIVEGKEQEAGVGIGAFVEFKKGAKVQVRVAISKVSAEQAEITFNREISKQSFSSVKDAAYKAWNNLLNRISVEGGTLEQRKTFYSCMFRANLRPGKDYELDEEGNPHFCYGGNVYEGYNYSNPILWDAFRCLLPLQNIINTEVQKKYVQSLLKTKPLTGWWPNGHVMIGNHAISVLADAWVKGVRTFDPELALKYYYNEITCSALDTINNGEYNREHVRGFGRMGFEDYFALGYIPYPQNTNRVMETTSKTLEYNYDDFCAYKLAQMIGNKFYENLFAKHLFNYRNVFDPSDQFFKGRDVEGKFDVDFNPYEWGGAFVEGNGWQWRFSVLQDPKGMIELMGGERQFASNLDELFSVPSDSVLYGGYGFWIHEINEAVAGGQGQYAQGNEPCFHVIHLYNYAKQPWKAQKLLRESMTKLYNSSPKGFPGDEDGGAMSSWYVLNAMGFYTVTPGVDQYVLGSPLFNKITISLENGETFTIIANNNDADHVYIKSAYLNGQPYTKNWFTHDTLMRGGELVLEMSKYPNEQRGILEEDKPYSLSTHD